jgi:putative N6-adenine-specific DNA methylase
MGYNAPMLNKTSDILITCAKGHSELLAQELVALGFGSVTTHATGAMTRGTMRDCMMLNLALRTAFNVYFLIKQFGCADPAILYRKIYDMDWASIVPDDGYMCVTSVADTPSIQNTMFLNQKVKDAIVDKIREQTGRRPNAGPDRDKTVISLFWKDEDVWLYVNTSGRKLSDRTYRKIPVNAPLQETLAASVLMTMGYDGSQTLVNPMCGSGTVAIEAALIALNKPASVLRPNFGFKHLVGFDKDLWEEVRKERRALERTELPAPIIATDIDGGAIEAAKQNAKTAGVEHLIQFERCDFRDTRVPGGCRGMVFMNPPYGLRLSDPGVGELYPAIGDFLKQRCDGYDAFVFTANREFAKTIRLRTSAKYPFFNGDLECRLLKFEMYQGTRRTFDKKDPSGTAA